MENASKALIIAGSVILAVLLIVLGFYFFNQASGIGKSINMSEYEIQAYNSKFLNYEGKVNGTKARDLCDVVRQHNLANATNGKMGVMLFYNAGEWDNTTAHLANELTSMVDAVKPNIKTGRFYEIKIMYDNSKGIVSAISINEL